MTLRNIDRLAVLHRLKDARGHGIEESSAAALDHGGLFIDTCLRQVWIGSIDNVPTPPSDMLLMQGPTAYNFLLQTICGLNSSVPGETNVAGQFRCAWKRWRNQATASQARELATVMHHLFNDSKNIRRDYLQNLGGASYGTLTRKLLRPESDAHILFIGSGKFALSLLPFFGNQQTALWNRRLHAGLCNSDFVATGTRVFAPAAATTAAAWASHLVLTIPAGSTADQQWAELAAAHGIEHVTHLSRRRALPGPWGEISIENYADLDDIFELRRRQSDLRDLNVLRARRACAALAAETQVAPLQVTATALPRQV